MPWGKYRGRLIADVPTSYLAWCLDASSIDELYRSAIRRELAFRLDLDLAPPPSTPILPPGELAPIRK
jgi:hypothetical protein